jgi:hypothetical protein
LNRPPSTRLPFISALPPVPPPSSPTLHLHASYGPARARDLGCVIEPCKCILSMKQSMKKYHPALHSFACCRVPSLGKDPVLRIWGMGKKDRAVLCWRWLNGEGESEREPGVRELSFRLNWVMASAGEAGLFSCRFGRYMSREGFTSKLD